MIEPFTHAEYRDILGAALSANYRFATFDQLETVKSTNERACFLRHDCDNDLVAALDVAAIESEMGIYSTYFLMPRSAMYNLFAPPNRSLVHEILKLGHRIGLHYDASLVAGQSNEVLRDEVLHEQALIAREFGSPVDVMSFHQPDQRILGGAIDVGMLNTYDASAFEGVFYYSDSNLGFRDGSPSMLFRKGEHRVIQLLLHPEWWTEVAMSLPEKWARMLANNVTLAQQSLLMREKTYDRAHRVRFDIE